MQVLLSSPQKQFENFIKLCCLWLRLNNWLLLFGSEWLILARTSVIFCEQCYDYLLNNHSGGVMAFLPKGEPVPLRLYIADVCYTAGCCLSLCVFMCLVFLCVIPSVFTLKKAFDSRDWFMQNDMSTELCSVPHSLYFANSMWCTCLQGFLLIIISNLAAP